MASLQAFPSSLLSRAWSRALIPFPFPFERLPRRLLRADLSPNNLECLTVEINKPRSKPFLVSTWYRPPQSSPDFFSTFERIIDKIDDENLELYLMGVACRDGCHETSRKAALTIVEPGITA